MLSDDIWILQIVFQILSDFYPITPYADYSKDSDKMVDSTKAINYLFKALIPGPKPFFLVDHIN